ncbi:MAG: hypothetical protein WA839_00885 [Flavobacteriaceae bacterium]
MGNGSELDLLSIGQLCSVCSRPAAKIEIIRDKNTSEQRWNLIYSGPGGSNGNGDLISEERKENLLTLFKKPYNLQEIKKEFYDMAGCCLKCEKFYCSTHWNISATGYGKCPEGHGQSLDPHY